MFEIFQEFRYFNIFIYHSESESNTIETLSPPPNKPTTNCSWSRSCSGRFTSIEYFSTPWRLEKSKTLVFLSHVTSIVSPGPNGKDT